MVREEHVKKLASLIVLVFGALYGTSAQAVWTEACGKRVWVDPPTDYSSCMANGRKMGCSHSANVKYCAKFKKG